MRFNEENKGISSVDQVQVIEELQDAEVVKGESRSWKETAKAETRDNSTVSASISVEREDRGRRQQRACTPRRHVGPFSSWRCPTFGVARAPSWLGIMGAAAEPREAGNMVTNMASLAVAGGVDELCGQ